jgi:hypothetical protein
MKNKKILTESESFIGRERGTNLTFPNMALTSPRLVGGLLVGGLMATKNIDAAVAATSAFALAATDAEGTLINVADKTPRLRDKLRIWPSKFGRDYDVIADKVYTAGMLGGGLIGGQIPLIPGLAIVASEMVTIGASANARTKIGENPQVSKWGKTAMISRFYALGAYITAPAVGDGPMSAVFENSGHVSAGLAVALGALSVMDIRRQGKLAEQIVQPEAT